MIKYSSNEYPQHMLLWSNKKNLSQNYHQILLLNKSYVCLWRYTHILDTNVAYFMRKYCIYCIHSGKQAWANTVDTDETPQVGKQIAIT